MKTLQKLLLIIPVITLLFLGCTKDSDDETIQFSINVSVTPTEGRVVTPTSGTYDEGTVVTMEATPSNGYSFVEWTGSIQSTDNPVAVTMDSNMDITAVFEILDSDEDGVTDDLDACPDTPSGEQVDENGCSDSQKDTDNDGISDDIDVCPNTPEGEEVNEQGCPITSAIYLDENGVTIKAYEWSQVGQTGEINGIVYTIVDETQLREMVESLEDVTRVCTSKVMDMSGVFHRTQFNQDIGSWDVSNVTDMSSMFSGDVISGDFTPFNQDISLWDVSNVTNMRYMFHFSSFNQSIGNWDVGNVTDMSNMFSISPFNQPIGNWNVSNVTNMSGMFVWTPFNQPIGNWNVGSVTDMSYMFNISPFNQPIGNWDVSKVTNMKNMFSGSWGLGAPNKFNQDISSWNVSGVTDMSGMFKESEINKDLSSWNVVNVISCEEFSVNTPQWTLPKPNFTNCNPD